MQILSPSEGMFSMATKMFKDAWGQRAGQMEAEKRLIRTERNKLAKQIEGLLDCLVDVDSPTLITASEKRIEKMEHEKLILDEKPQKSGKPMHTFEYALQFLSPSPPLEKRQKTALRLAFAEKSALHEMKDCEHPKETFHSRC